MLLMVVAYGACTALSLRVWPEQFGEHLSRIGLLVALLPFVMVPGAILLNRTLTPRQAPPPYATVSRWRHVLCYAPAYTAFWTVWAWAFYMHPEDAIPAVLMVVSGLLLGIIIPWWSYPRVVDADRRAAALLERWEDE